uniref:Transmembrane protein 71 n=1 Tax=Lepisosteus oculatus TaxID=7918 RepID=W5N4T7_LEPOC
MSLLFSKVVASSPIRKRPFTDQTCHSLSLSPLSSDCSYECYSVNPLTGSPCKCRRSPRLLSNGYYVLTEDSFVCDDEGNLSLTPSKTNVSYKENLVRIFRRRRKSHRSLASLFNLSESCGSWLDSSIFGDVHSPLAESSWIERNSDLNSSSAYDITYDSVLPGNKAWPVEDQPSELHTEACFSHEQFRQSLGGFLDLSASPPFAPRECYYKKTKQSDSTISRVIFLLILAVCFCVTVFSRWLLAVLVIASVTSMLIFTSFFLTKSSFGKPVRPWNTKTEDITSRNE